MSDKHAYLSTISALLAATDRSNKSAMSKDELIAIRKRAFKLLEQGHSPSPPPTQAKSPEYIAGPYVFEFGDPKDCFSYAVKNQGVAVVAVTLTKSGVGPKTKCKKALYGAMIQDLNRHTKRPDSIDVAKAILEIVEDHLDLMQEPWVVETIEIKHLNYSDVAGPSSHSWPFLRYELAELVDLRL